jgi:F-type H+-transporting ATPase subunit a
VFVTGFRDVRDVAAEQAKVDPMYQFTIEPLAGSGGWEIAGYNIAFTNSALWMPFTFTSHFTVTGVLAIISFSIVLLVGFWKHGLHFFSLFVPEGTPLPMIPILAPIEFISFMVRPFSLGLRLFVAMMAGHVLLEVLSSFVIDGTNAGATFGLMVGLPSFILMIGICALELLVAGIQAYVFALLTSLYINDAENLH